MKSLFRLCFLAILLVALISADSGSGRDGGDSGSDGGDSGRGGDDGERGDDGWGNSGGRDIGVKVDNDEITIRGTHRGENENAVAVDAVGFTFSTKFLPMWVVSYFSRDADSAATTSSRWSLWKLVEYSESGDAQGFQPDQDTIATEWRLWNQKWSDMTVTKDESGNATVYSFCTQMTRSSGGGNDRRDQGPSRPQLPFVFRICNFVTDRAAIVNGTKASPNALKWSLEISNYPYQSNNTHLALKAAFDSATTIRNLTGDNLQSERQDALEISSTGDVATAITWATGVDLEGTDCPTTANVSRSQIYSGSVSGDSDADAPRGDRDASWTKSVQLAYFSFLTDCQPDKIFWDPEFGVVTAANTQSSSGHMATVAIALVLAIAALL